MMPTTNFNFVPIERSHMGGAVLPANIVRLNTRSISLGVDVLQPFMIGRVHRDSGTDSIKVGLHVDKENKAFQITPPTDIIGCTFTITDRNSGNISYLPAKLKEADMPIGDYVAVPGHTNVYQLAE